MSVTAVHILQVGACRHPEIMSRRGGHLCPVDFPALVGLIVHESWGPILFDTGYDRRFFTATEPFPERLYRLATPVSLPEQPLEDQLKTYGYAPDDIAAVVVSHFHGDHVAGLTRFTQARIFCARAGLEATRRGSRFTRVRQGLLGALVPEDIDRRATFFEVLPPEALGDDLAPFTHGVDLCGDGSLIAVELPGHCKGHWGLWVPQARLFFIGDAAWSLDAVEDNVPPPALTTGLLGHTATYRATLTALNALSKRGRVEIIPSHCARTAGKWVRHG
ncbi:MBL fold metallo-hydrolase [Asticcacaulis sp. BYS171W]|uniref:MBL fold metallo-hydrolase n=1 Tax=Asticcacaulis aquaticus TaxID=2984212 RepID=A0ABT5HX15_9CAUL|nr:MBL fold metallo-hydrolase [Asticcacaulis aquaticus]MDC7684598.1 MBL fold metallo-hydrolase [Asticcacaulis aquaticus]